MIPSLTPIPPGVNITAPTLDAVAWMNVAWANKISDPYDNVGSPAPDRILSSNQSSRHSMNQPGTLMEALTAIGFGESVFVIVSSIISHSL